MFNPRTGTRRPRPCPLVRYHTAARGQSKKLQLMNIINDCMRHASSREEFIALMEARATRFAGKPPGGTSPTPHPAAGSAVTACCSGTKYLKENMEY